ncbi:NAD(P)H-binding protein [Methylocapsa sp. S129]|uniref:NmrA family NAD(P)-binding protein n=1 Tax=Methylocapsa sp. S129 TaxID=1641869 RepID=UPI00131C3F0D|nr:NAD(P)H-binding protein [Methylocapsa sp. S129]
MFAIIGATGKAGRATVGELRKRGLPVRAVVRDRSKALDLEALGCEIAIADLGDAGAIAKAIEGAQAVQAICPISPQMQDPATDMRAIVDAICDALAIARPARVLAISDYGAERGAGTGVTLAFHYLEAQLRKTARALILLRSSEHMQNWSRLFKVAADTGILPSLHHPLTKLFPMVSASDVGLVAADLLASPGFAETPRVVYVEGPCRYTALDVAKVLSGAFGRDVAARELPRPDWLPTLMRGGLSANYAGLVAELYDAHNSGLIDVEPGATDIRRGKTDFADLPIFQRAHQDAP